MAVPSAGRNHSPVVGRGGKNEPVLRGNAGGNGRNWGMSPLRVIVFGGLLLTACSLVAGETGAGRLGDAQEDMANASWPRKPDARLSPLSGKMKSISEISPTYYGQGREFSTVRLDPFEKKSSLGDRPAWDREDGPHREQERWGGGTEFAGGAKKSGRYQAQQTLASSDTRVFRQIPGETASGWSSRSDRVTQKSDGGLKMYEGRLTRVRARMVEKEKNVRDLGAGRQESYRPDQVEKMLSQPLGDLRGPVRESPAAASPPGAGGN